MRAVLDPNVIISAALFPNGFPGRASRHWLEGAFDLVVSPALLDELRRALDYSKLRERIRPDEADELVELLARAGSMTPDQDVATGIRSSDPNDDYLITLASISNSVLVSGDSDLLKLSDAIPVYSPAEFLLFLEEPGGTN